MPFGCLVRVGNLSPVQRRKFEVEQKWHNAANQGSSHATYARRRVVPKSPAVQIREAAWISFSRIGWHGNAVGWRAEAFSNWRLDAIITVSIATG
jgi:hypothetical protein